MRVLHFFCFAIGEYPGAPENPRSKDRGFWFFGAATQIRNEARQVALSAPSEHEARFAYEAPAGTEGLRFAS